MSPRTDHDHRLTGTTRRARPGRSPHRHHQARAPARRPPLAPGTRLPSTIQTIGSSAVHLMVPPQSRRYLPGSRVDNLPPPLGVFPARPSLISWGTGGNAHSIRCRRSSHSTRSTPRGRPPRSKPSGPDRVRVCIVTGAAASADPGAHQRQCLRRPRRSRTGVPTATSSASRARPSMNRGRPRRRRSHIQGPSPSRSIPPARSRSVLRAAPAGSLPAIR